MTFDIDKENLHVVLAPATAFVAAATAAAATTATTMTEDSSKDKNNSDSPVLFVRGEDVKSAAFMVELPILVHLSRPASLSMKSAMGNLVGGSTNTSCKRQLDPDMKWHSNWLLVSKSIKPNYFSYVGTNVHSKSFSGTT